MDKLVASYKNKCEIVSNRADNMWKKGIIIFFILYSIVYLAIPKKLICILFFIIIINFWFYVCAFIYDKELKRKTSIKIKKVNKNEKKKYLEYEQILDKYQKDFISNYVRKNKLNKLGKLKIIIDEIQKEIDKKEEIKNIFIIPSVLTMFTSVINYDNNLGSLSFVIQYGVIVISAIMTIITFYKLYNCTTFNKYSGMGRLKDLLIHTSIKCGRL